MEKTDYYSILQVDPNATQDQLRFAYKRLALAWHPDLSQHPEAHRRMQLLNEAYGVLGSQEKRAEYDRWRLAPVVAVPAAPAPAPARPAEAPPPAPPVAPQPPIDVEKQQALERKWRAWLKRQLKILAFSILYTLALFAWTLLSGEINLLVVLLLFAPIVVVFVMLFRWLRRPIH